MDEDINPATDVTIPATAMVGVTTERAEITRVLNVMRGRYDRSTVVIACDTNDRSILGIRTPFNAPYIAELKIHIPSSEREWNPETRTWFVNSSYYNIIIELCSKYIPQYSLRQSNTTGLELLVPKKNSGPKSKSDITTQAIKALKTLDIEMDDFDYEEVVFVIVTAWRNKQITDLQSMELLDKLYS